MCTETLLYKELPTIRKHLHIHKAIHDCENVKQSHSFGEDLSIHFILVWKFKSSKI